MIHNNNWMNALKEIKIMSWIKVYFYILKTRGKQNPTEN